MFEKVRKELTYKVRQMNSTCSKKFESVFRKCTKIDSYGAKVRNLGHNKQRRDEKRREEQGEQTRMSRAE